jgi:hypothetical protein
MKYIRIIFLLSIINFNSFLFASNALCSSDIEEIVSLSKTIGKFEEKLDTAHEEIEKCRNDDRRAYLNDQIHYINYILNNNKNELHEKKNDLFKNCIK